LFVYRFIKEAKELAKVSKRCPGHRKGAWDKKKKKKASHTMPIAVVGFRGRVLLRKEKRSLNAPFGFQKTDNE